MVVRLSDTLERRRSASRSVKVYRKLNSTKPSLGGNDSKVGQKILPQCSEQRLENDYFFIEYHPLYIVYWDLWIIAL